MMMMMTTKMLMLLMMIKEFQASVLGFKLGACYGLDTETKSISGQVFSS